MYQDQVDPESDSESDKLTTDSETPIESAYEDDFNENKDILWD